MDTNIIVKYHQEQMKALDEAIQYLHDMKSLSEDKGDKKIYKEFARAARYAYIRLGKERPMVPSFFNWCKRCGGDLLTKGRPYDYCPWCGQRISHYEPLSYEKYRPEIARFYKEEEDYDDYSNDYVPRSDDTTDNEPFEVPQFICNAYAEQQTVSSESRDYDGWTFNED